jgi:hypothetical protein
VVPRTTGKRRVTKESSRDGIACSLTDFSVFSQVGDLTCIEFLNRVRRFDSSRGHHLNPHVNGPILSFSSPGSSRVAPHWSRRGHRVVPWRSQLRSGGIPLSIKDVARPLWCVPVLLEEKRGRHPQRRVMVAETLVRTERALR